MAALKRPSARRGLEVAVWLILGLLPLGLGDWQMGQLALFFCYGIFAMSLALVWGQGGLLCFGQAVFFGIGAYAMSLYTLGMLPWQSAAGGSLAGLAIAVLVPAAFAYLLGRFLFHGKGLRGAYLGIVTLAIAIIAERLAINWDYAGGLNGLMNVPPLTVPGFAERVEIWDSGALYYTSLAAAFAVYLLFELLLASRFGLVLRAIRSDEDRAQFLGFDTADYKIWVFTLGAAAAGLAGALFVTQFNFVSPALIGFTLSTEVLIWVAVGGRGFLLAAFLGALVVRGLEDRLSEALGSAWLLVLGLIFVTVVVAFPRGLIGQMLSRLERRAGTRGTPIPGERNIPKV
jgi:urea ABC transporter permease protein UrtC